MFNYDSFPLLCGRNQHNVVNQLSSNPDFFFKKKEGPGGLFKAQTAGPTPRVSDSVGLQWGLKS